MDQVSKEQQKRGPKPKYKVEPKQFHLKFSGEMLEHIKRMAGNNYQAYFDRLVQEDIQRRKEEVRA